MGLLGKTVQDTVSNFTGVAVATHHYLNGCTRTTVQPPIDKEGKLPASETFDTPQLVVLIDTAIKGNNDTGGPEKYTDNRKF